VPMMDMLAMTTAKGDRGANLVEHDHLLSFGPNFI
jgi:hypothetical protein